MHRGEDLRSDATGDRARSAGRVVDSVDRARERRVGSSEFLGEVALGREVDPRDARTVREARIDALGNLSRLAGAIIGVGIGIRGRRDAFLF